MAEYVAYYRVSTDKQGVHGLGMIAQRDTVHKHMVDGDTIIAAYEEAESGRKTKRPQLNKALEHCRTSGATLIIARLDRLARNAAFLLSLEASGVEFIACDLPSANRLVVGIMGMVAEEEARLYNNHTKKALAQTDKQLGNPRWAETIHKAHEGSTKAADEFAVEVYPHICQLRKDGIKTFSGLARALNGKDGSGKVDTLKGGRWWPQTVSDLIRRVEK